MPSPTLPEQSLESIVGGRSLTWPPTTVHCTTNADKKRITTSPPTPHDTMPFQPRQAPRTVSFEDEINEDPASHFLSPAKMAYEYEDWAEDSDDDAEEVEWDAGITDFALFHQDRRQAQARRTSVPDRWESLLSSQASALQRAVQRNRSDSDPTRARTWTPLAQDVPHLTPDNSPTLRDDFDIDHYCGGHAPRPSIPNYLQSAFAPSEELSDDDDYDYETDSDDEELPIDYLVERARERRRAARKMERPGMRFNRTMSGKVHVWRRPSWQLHDVGEDPEAERRAELASVQHDQPRVQHQEAEQRGRRR
ncbi:hypothetical protein CB0940_08026 [Cercospora beticola]|uniref:Uncharacterized protein n=1 Tax=Cercospora beticola TaxID=122368 RepID=A0A2G5HNS4_CERBT|nr:hypothetical protein CB0940_08026 [Cercospora beticola]PIA94194.1 hypothetical protein CB0940_08026 [Cercospora beticola]WPB04582.1 hypothetical protein RHO25_009228 [Cercospora beticola]